MPRFTRRLHLGESYRIAIGRTAALSGLGSVAQSITRSLTNIAIGRLAGAAVLGTVSSALSLSNLLSLLWPATAGNAAAKFIGRFEGAGDSDGVRAIAAYLGRQTLLVSLLLGVASLPLWAFIGGGSPRSYLALGLLVVALSLGNYCRGIHYGTGAVGRSTAWDVISSTLSLVAVVAFLLGGGRDINVLFAVVLGYLVYVVACWPKHANGSVPPSIRREIRHFIVVGSFGTLASAGFLQLAVIVVRSSAGDVAAGHYAAALALATPAALIARALSTALYPRMAQDFGRGATDSVRSTTDRFTRLLMIILVGGLGTMAIVKDMLVHLVWGPDFQASAKVLPALLLAVFLTGIRVPSVNFLSSGPQRGITLTTLCSLAGLASGAVFWWLQGPSVDPMEAALGYVIGSLVTTLMVAAFAMREGHQRWMWLFGRGFAGITLASCLVAVQELTDMGNLASFALSALFLLAWGALCIPDIRTLRDRAKTAQ